MGPGRGCAGSARPPGPSSLRPCLPASVRARCRTGDETSERPVPPPGGGWPPPDMGKYCELAADFKGQMLDEDHTSKDGAADELLRRALLDDSSAVTVSLRVDGLPVSQAVTVIFHARRDLG